MSEFDSAPVVGTARVKRGMAEMLKGGVIMDVVTPDQARLPRRRGRCRHGAGTSSGRYPGDGGVARMSDPDMIDGIIEGGLHPGDGQGADRSLCRGPDCRRWGRLHRRVRGPHPGR